MTKCSVIVIIQSVLKIFCSLSENLQKHFRLVKALPEILQSHFQKSGVISVDLLCEN